MYKIKVYMIDLNCLEYCTNPFMAAKDSLSGHVFIKFRNSWLPRAPPKLTQWNCTGKAKVSPSEIANGLPSRSKGTCESPSKLNTFDIVKFFLDMPLKFWKFWFFFLFTRPWIGAFFQGFPKKGGVVFCFHKLSLLRH